MPELTWLDREVLKLAEDIADRINAASPEFSFVERSANGAADAIASLVQMFDGDGRASQTALDSYANPETDYRDDEADGISGQDRESYSDTQDRESYVPDEEDSHGTLHMLGEGVP